MRLCRFGKNRLGVVTGSVVHDVTPALEVLPPLRWPVPQGDHLIRHLGLIRAAAERLLPDAPVLPLERAPLLSPVANPSKVIAAPLNYTKHVEEVAEDPQINAKTHTFQYEGFRSPIDKLGLFLKAGSSIVGPSEGIVLTYPERRTDHEVELVAVIGRQAKDIAESDALAYVCGYCVGLDVTVRGPEDRSFRKSPDTYTVLGPALVTADEVGDAGAFDLSLTLNGEARQRANTRDLTVGLARLIAIAASCYTLHPGDVIMTGTPEGVSELAAGDDVRAVVAGLGELRVRVRAGVTSSGVHGQRASAA